MAGIALAPKCFGSRIARCATSYDNDRACNAGWLRMRPRAIALQLFLYIGPPGPSLDALSRRWPSFVAIRASPLGSPKSCSMRLCSGSAAGPSSPSLRKIRHRYGQPRSFPSLCPKINPRTRRAPWPNASSANFSNAPSMSCPTSSARSSWLEFIEDMSIDETADLLGLRPETVKTRLHRARRLLKEALADHIDPLFSDVFPFAGKRCESIADAVVKRLNLSG